MDDIALSILMVTYNHEKYIEDAIVSIIQQETEYAFELIIGDDASNDTTAQIIKKYARQYPEKIHAVLRKENLGATRNSYGILKRARGKYIAFCDGDDLWVDKYRIQKQIDFLDAHFEYSAICGKCKFIDEDGKEMKREQVDSKLNFWQFESSVYKLEDFEQWRMPGHISSIMGRNVFRTADCRILYQAHDIVGDRTLMLLFVLDGNVCCNDDIVSNYRIQKNGNNFMSKYQSRNLRYQDFRLMKMLEVYSLNIRKRKMNLFNIKRERLIGAVVTFINRPNYENWTVVFKIILQSQELVKYLWYTVKIVFLMFYHKYILQEEKKIVL